MTKIVRIEDGTHKKQCWVVFECNQCGAQKRQAKSHFDAQTNHFCSKECRYKWRRDHPWGPKKKVIKGDIMARMAKISL